MKKAEKPKYVLRLPPCPDYDVEGTECWLTDLAREGLLLKKDGLSVDTDVLHAMDAADRIERLFRNE